MRDVYATLVMCSVVGLACTQPSVATPAETRPAPKGLRADAPLRELGKDKEAGRLPCCSPQGFGDGTTCLLCAGVWLWSAEWQ